MEDGIGGTLELCLPLFVEYGYFPFIGFLAMDVKLVLEHEELDDPATDTGAAETAVPVEELEAFEVDGFVIIVEDDGLLDEVVVEVEPFPELEKPSSGSLSKVNCAALGCTDEPPQGSSIERMELARLTLENWHQTSGQISFPKKYMTSQLC